jgi:hypothetical protein
VSKILAARRLARGQSHDAHALDGRILKKRDTFSLKAGREGRGVAGARNPAPGGTSLRIMSWRDRDSGTHYSTSSPFTSAP